jgi:hypothetical protein
MSIGQDEAGSVLVYAVLSFPVLLALACLALDGSNIYLQHQRMQIAADAAALAGARAVALELTNTQVNSEVNSLAAQNGSDSVTWSYIPSGKGVQTQTAITFPTFFAGILGYSTFGVQATASADVASVTSAGNLLPMTIMCDDMSNDTDPGFTYGVIYTLKDGANNAPGNKGWLDWNGGSSNAPELAANIANPSNSGVWEIGDWIPGATGNMNSSAVRQALDGWIGKPVTIPLYDMVTGNGSNVQYRVCSFAEFVMTSYDNREVRGMFVRALERGDTDAGNPPDFGVRSVGLAQ